MTITRLDHCLVCNSAVPPVDFDLRGIGAITCQVCGNYFVSQEFAEDGIDSRTVQEESRHIIQAWIKRRPLLGVPTPLLTQDLCIRIIGETPDYTPTERMEQLLLAYAELCKLPSRAYRAQANFDYPYAFARDKFESSEYFSWLKESRLIHDMPEGVQLTREGWERAARLRKVSPASGRTCFVAMWFDDSMDDAWTRGLLPGAKDAGFTARRLKEEIHADRIDARIVAAIRESRFMVADVTGSRQAVYYEAGFADGLGKTVIWTCRSGDEDKLCFDTRQFRHIIWNEPIDLRSQLASTIKALVP